MTFHEQPISPTQMLIDPRETFFMNWGRKNMNRLFSYDVGRDPLIDKMYILLKRLHGITPESFLTMDADDRDALYNMEKQLLEHDSKKGEGDLEELYNN